MKKIVIAIIGILLVFALGMVIFLGYLGMFSSLKPGVKVFGPYTFAYEEYTGAYKDTGPVFDRVYKALQKEGINSTRGLGIYFDDPRKVPEEKLRSYCGSIIETKDMQKFEKIKGKFKVKTLQKSRSAFVEFPIKTSLSYMVGPMKCYPALTEYVKQKGFEMHGNAYELYDMPMKKTYFIFPIKE